jgi:hypothetical protein
MFKSEATTSYVTGGRLADVMALIQILAFDPSARRSSDGLDKQLARGPLSASTWTELATLHPEFFRVLEGEPGQRESISLVARFVLEAVPNAAGETKTPPLGAEVTSTLMNLAVQLHDREVQRRDRWKTVLVPVIVAILAAAASITAALVISSAKARDLGNAGTPQTPVIQATPSK